METAYSYDELNNQLLSLKEYHPCLSYEIIGHSVLGKEIIAFKLGTGKREVHYNAAIHANEWITALLLIRFLKLCLTTSEVDSETANEYNLQALLNKTTLWIVPLLNPDGVKLVLDGIPEGHPQTQQLLEWNNHSTDFSLWKANWNGVDLNDQFPANWEAERIRRNVTIPAPLNYSGESPLCEPEAMAIANFTERHSFELVISLHTQGEEIYWNYRGYEPGNSEEIANKLAALSGYSPIYLTDSDAGYKDWFIQCFRKPGFTVEVGLGATPLPIDQLDEIYKKVLQILLLGLDSSCT